MSDHQRLFIAIGLPPEAAEELSQTLPRPEIDGLRWVDPPHWHVTLQFLGEVPTERIDEVRLACAFAAGRVQPFTLSFAGVGAFPNERRARVVWVGVLAGEGRVAALATSVRSQTSRRGFEDDESREFQAHLTVGRLGVPTDVTEALASLDAGPTSFEVREIQLFHSLLSPGGARYEVLDRFPLQT